MSKLKVLFDENQVQEKILEIANQLNKKYENADEITFICVLSGSIMFCSDLIKRINIPTQIEFVKVSSYENSMTTGIIKEVLFNLPNLKNRDVIIVEDIVDTGITAKYLTDRINNDFHPKSLCFVSLLDKKCKRQIDIDPDIYGFNIDDKFVVGYGLDDDKGHGRNLPYIAYVE